MNASRMIPDDAPKVVKAGELAGWLGVKELTIWRWVGKGFLPRPYETQPGQFWFATEKVRKWLRLRPWAGGPLKMRDLDYRMRPRVQFPDE